jgi:hypothetical protein
MHAMRRAKTWGDGSPLMVVRHARGDRERRMKTTTVPYEGATSGAAARDEISKLLRRFGCESVGFMDDFDDHSVLLAFKHRGRSVQLRASAKGWAALYLKAHPYNPARVRRPRHQHEQAALRQGFIAVNSILRDWVKGQITAVECGMLSFDAVFMPFVLTNDGRTVLERIAEAKMLPAPTP